MLFTLQRMHRQQRARDHAWPDAEIQIQREYVVPVVDSIKLSLGECRRELTSADKKKHVTAFGAKI